MIQHLDNLIRHLFLTHVDEVNDEVQVRFQPPNSDWRTYVSNLTVGGNPANALNVYLTEVRENRELRSNARNLDIQNGVSMVTPAPRRIDCHYVISAWSSANVTPTIEPTVDEHALLYKALHALMQHDPLIATDIYAPGPPPPGVPELMLEHPLPTEVSPQDGFPKLSEFWSNVDSPWRPVVYLVVTLPVAEASTPTGPVVTTRVAEYRIMNATGPADRFVQASGFVGDTTHPLGSGDPAPVPNAWVQLESNAGLALQTTHTDNDGLFYFGNLRDGNYLLRARAVGLGEVSRNIQVPTVEAYSLLYS